MTYTTAARTLTTTLAVSAVMATPIAAASTLTPVEPSSSPTPVQPREADPHRVVHRDARGDVLRFDVASEESEPAPRDRATDITKTLVDHRADRLVISATARELTRSGYRLVIAEILGSDGRRYQLTTDYSAALLGVPGSRVSLTRFHSGRDVRCAGASWRVDRAADRVVSSVPTSCLGDPAWLRVGVALIGAPKDFAHSWGDDSRTTSRLADDHLALGPRQHHA